MTRPPNPPPTGDDDPLAPPSARRPPDHEVPLWPGQPPGTQLAASLERQSKYYEFGIDAQFGANRALALKEGYYIPDDPRFRFADNDTSGALRTRDGLDRYRRAVSASGGAPFLRAYGTERSRFSRWPDPRRLLAFELWCQDRGVLLRYGDESDPARIAEGEAGDAARSGAFLGGAAKTVFTSQERTTTRRRTRRGRRSRFLKGFFVGGAPPYATEKWLVDIATGAFLEKVEFGARVTREGCASKLRWVEGPEYATVRRIFAEAERGASLRGIAARLNRDGVAAPSGRLPASTYQGVRPPHWHVGAVGDILHHPIYIGDLTHPKPGPDSPAPVPAAAADPAGDEPIYYRDFLPGAPIARDAWARTHEALAGRPGQYGRKRHTAAAFLAGLVVCAACGKRFAAHLVPARGDGTRVYRYYRHYEPAAGPDACPHIGHAVNAEQLHPFALEVTARALLPEGIRADVAAELARVRREAAGAGAGRAVARSRQDAARFDKAAQQAIYNAALATVEGARTKHRAAADHFAGRAEEARAEAARLEGHAAELASAERRLTAAGRGCPDLAAAFAAAGADEQRRIVHSVVRQVRVDLGAGTAEFLVEVLAE